jgi:hypothetical protein
MMKRASAILVFLAATTAGLSADWPMWRGNAAHTGTTPRELPEQLSLQWSRTLPPLTPGWPDQPRMQMDAVYEPIVHNGMLFVPSPRNDGLTAYDAGVLRLALSPSDEMLKSTASMKTLAQALAPAFGTVPQIRFEAAATSGETLHQRSARERDARQEAAESAFLADPGVQQLIRQHGAQVVPDSIRPFDE